MQGSLTDGASARSTRDAASASAAENPEAAPPTLSCTLIVADVDGALQRAGVMHPQRWLPLCLQTRCE